MNLLSLSVFLKQAQRVFEGGGFSFVAFATFCDHPLLRLVYPI